MRAGEIIDSSLSVSDNERVSGSVTAGATYFVQVVGFGSAVNRSFNLTIDAPGVHPDRFENDDTFAEATLLPNTQFDHRLENLTIDAAGDDDFFQFTALGQPTDTHTIQVDFEHAEGDLDLFIYDAPDFDSLIGSSESATDGEHLALTLIPGNTYFVRVVGFDGAIQQQYDLTIDGPGIEPDSFEDNNDQANAVTLPNHSLQTLSHLTLDSSTDEDFFRIVPSQNGAIDLRLLFDPNLGDADIVLTDSNGNVIGTSRRGRLGQSTTSRFPHWDTMRSKSTQVTRSAESTSPIKAM